MPQPISQFLPDESSWARLLATYDHPVPRYTSYPPVPAWTDDPALARRRMEIAARGDDRIALYVHIPFCPTLCYYCACNRVITKDAELVNRYLTAIAAEIQSFTARVGRRPLAAMHWGGGTPNSLTSEQTTHLFRAIATGFDLETAAEISIEIDPRLATRGQLALYAALGFNRMSFGVQDFQAATQELIHRRQSFEQTAAAVEWAREFEISNVNIDLVYGLPLQTRQTLMATLEQVLRLGPDSVAMYAYAHVPWFNRAQRAYERSLPSQGEKFGMLIDAIRTFENSDYEYIGIDHFAAPNGDLARAAGEQRIQRTFMGYTRSHTRTLVGIGASAISATTDAYVQNASAIDKYIRGAAGSGLLQRGCLLTPDAMARKKVIEALMVRGAARPTEVKHLIAPRAFDKHFASAIAALGPMVDDGLVTVLRDRISLTPLGRLFARNVASCFDAATPRRGTQHASAV